MNSLWNTAGGRENSDILSNSHFGGERWAGIQAIVTSKVLWSFSVRQNPVSLRVGRVSPWKVPQGLWCLAGIDNSWMLGGDHIMKGLIWGVLELCPKGNRKPLRDFNQKKLIREYFKHRKIMQNTNELITRIYFLQIVLFFKVIKLQINS